MTQIGHTDPGFTLRVYAHMMNRDPKERARLKGLVEGERSIAPAQMRQLRSSDYEQPILNALADLGGNATRKEIAQLVHTDLAPKMTDNDEERVPSGMRRWQTHLSKARTNLIRKELIKADSPRGRWVLERCSSHREKVVRRISGRASWGGSERSGFIG